MLTPVVRELAREFTLVRIGPQVHTQAQSCQTHFDSVFTTLKLPSRTNEVLAHCLTADAARGSIQLSSVKGVYMMLATPPFAC